MDYMNDYRDDVQSKKIPYDDIPITRNYVQRKQPQNSGRSKKSLKKIYSFLVILFVVQIVSTFSIVYFIKNRTVKYVNVNNISIEGADNASVTAAAAAKAYQSAVCISAGGVCNDKSTFFSNTSSHGAGVIYKISGSTCYVVTCYHVIQGFSASNIYVLFSTIDSPVTAASVVGYSSRYDVAVIRFDNVEDELLGASAVSIYNTSTLVLCEDVITVGNPLGDGFSILRGEISQINEMITIGSNSYQTRELRISNPINPGNSGGGLFNANGEFIGIVNATLSTAKSSGKTYTVNGISYAIPGNLVCSIADNIIHNNTYPVCVDLGIKFANSETDNITTDNTIRYFVQSYTVLVSEKDSAISNVAVGDIVKSFTYTDIFGEVHENVKMLNMYSFEDVKFLVKPNTNIIFSMSNRLTGDYQATIYVSNTTTY